MANEGKLITDNVLRKREGGGGKSSFIRNKDSIRQYLVNISWKIMKMVSKIYNERREAKRVGGVYEVWNRRLLVATNVSSMFVFQMVAQDTFPWSILLDSNVTRAMHFNEGFFLNSFYLFTKLEIKLYMIFVVILIQLASVLDRTSSTVINQISSLED